MAEELPAQQALSDALGAAAEAQQSDVWANALDRFEVHDAFTFLANRGFLGDGDRYTRVCRWLNSIGHCRPPNDALYHATEDDAPFESRIAFATFERWTHRLKELLATSEHVRLPDRGVIQYFSDELAVCVVVSVRRVGSTVELNELLAFPNPEAFFDPIAALQYARTDAQLDLLRRALFSRHKVVVHRNVLVYVDREAEQDVFGPSIDTLFLSEFLFQERYAAQRTHEDERCFEPVIPSNVARDAESRGMTFLEIGSGNGLLTAGFARNEAYVKEFRAIDVAIGALVATHRNSATQRLLPRGGRIGDRGVFVASPYHLSKVPHGNDIVLCNPPYVPLPPSNGNQTDAMGLHPLRHATLGTSLLERVVGDAPQLLAADGVLYLVSSELAEPEIMAAVPRGFSCVRRQRRRVPFDLASVREVDGLADWLVEVRSLESESDGQGYHHWIAVYEIRRTA